MCPNKEPEYKYTKLNDLRQGFRFNVFGILVEVNKESKPTSTGTLHSIYHITDESLQPNQSFRMHCFSRSVPVPNFSVGDILRFHRVKVETSGWQGNLDGRVFQATDIVSFSSDDTSGFQHTSAAQNITLSDQDKIRISELREMASLNALFFESSPEFTNNTTDIPKKIPTNTNDQGDLQSKEHSTENMETDVQLSSKKLLQNPTAGPSGAKCLLPNPFYGQTLKNKETEGDSSKKRTSLELDSPNNETEVSENVANKKASITVNITERKKYKPCPLSKKKKYKEEVTSPYKKQSTEEGEELSSAAVLAQRVQTLVKETNNPSEVRSHDVGSLFQAETTSTCPGIICAGENCGQAPILIGADAGHSDNEDPTCDIGGEIPAADDEGNVFVRKQRYMNFEVEKKNTYIDANSMENFQWPCYSAKVRIMKIKPSLQVLKSHGPKNLLSGVCKTCGTYSYYSKLKWKINKDSSTKKPLCPVCNENGVTSVMYIEFRLRLTVVDAWGTHLNVYVTREKASKFLGCSQSQYHSSKEVRLNTTSLLSDALSSKCFFTIFLFCVNTMNKKMIYVYDTELSKALTNFN